jgi:hypothetical protein
MTVTKANTLLGGALVACLCAIIAVPTFASEFKAKSVPVEVKVTNLSPFIVEVPGISAPLECGSVTGKGRITKNGFQQAPFIAPSKCLLGGFVSARVTGTHVNLHANGGLSLEGELVVKVEAGGCELVIAGTSNKSLAKVIYNNTKADIEVISNVSGLTETSTGSLCGTSGKEAKYKSSLLIESETPGVRLEVA